MAENEFDNRIVTGRQTPRFFWLLVFACLLVGIGGAAVWYQDLNCLLLALLPFVVVGFIILTWPRRQTWLWEEDGLSLKNGEEKVLFNEIQGVTLRGACPKPEKAKKKGWLSINHARGTLFLPPNVIPAVHLLYQSILDKVSIPSGAPESQKLKKYYEQQLETFGPEKVFAFNPRFDVDHRGNNNAWVAFWMILFGIGVAWITRGVIDEKSKPMIVSGIFVVFVSTIGMIVPVVNKSQIKKMPLGVVNWREAGLVVGPMGIAMVQGNDSGILKWEEVKGVALGRAFVLAGGNRNPFRRTLFVQVKGADVCVVDIYNYPLAKIYQLIQSYWKPPLKK